jgi:hypothetical protein
VCRDRRLSMSRPRANAQDGLDALRASATSARALERVKALCGCRLRAQERTHAQSNHDQSESAEHCADNDAQFLHVRLFASARDGQDALWSSAATARALETVLTLRGRRPQAREHSRRDGLDAAGVGRRANWSPSGGLRRPLGSDALPGRPNILAPHHPLRLPMHCRKRSGLSLGDAPNSHGRCLDVSRGHAGVQVGIDCC